MKTADAIPLVPPASATEGPRAGKTPFETLRPAGMPRFPALDGWRAVSILLVMAGHEFPLGPKRFTLNGSISELGMAIFFTLSGFLITSTLLFRPSIMEFLIRRLCRIVPAAWAFSIVALSVAGASWHFFLAQLLFFSNLPPFPLVPVYTGHLWSLGVEMQFYLVIALICAILGRRGLWSVPVLCLLVTAHRIQTHTLVSIITTLRVDEILSGGTLALICNTPHLPLARKVLTRLSPLLFLPFAFAACFEISGALNYLRPYLVSGMVGTTLFYESGSKPLVIRWLEARWLAYLAAISYALYLLHPTADWGWFGSGSKTAKYVKRIPAFLTIFGLAHLSTFYYEAFWIKRGKIWSKRFTKSSPHSEVVAKA